MNLHELLEELWKLKGQACGVTDRKQAVSVGENCILI
jgi:hypothetical protein